MVKSEERLVVLIALVQVVVNRDISLGLNKKKAANSQQEVRSCRWNFRCIFFPFFSFAVGQTQFACSCPGIFVYQIWGSWLFLVRRGVSLRWHSFLLFLCWCCHRPEGCIAESYRIACKCLLKKASPYDLLISLSLVCLVCRLKNKLMAGFLFEMILKVGRMRLLKFQSIVKKVAEIFF